MTSSKLESRRTIPQRPNIALALNNLVQVITMPENAISIQFNGQPLEMPAGSSVVELLEHVEMRSQLVAVEINMEIIPKDDHAAHQLQSGDVVEVVTLVGGG